MDNIKIGVVIVLYNPAIEELNATLDRLQSQVDQICLVDNSSVDNGGKININNKVNYIPIKENVGIAKAQNIGIKYLQKVKMDFILFCDQDSSCEKGLVEKLVSIYLNLEIKGYNIAVIGPTPYNKNTSENYPEPNGVVIDNFDISVGNIYHILERYYIPSSYSLARATTFNIVGFMEEDLFIDGVDFEWCWRARYYNNKVSYRVCELKFAHFFGEETNLPINKSSSFRLYYQYRNYIRLSKRKYTPFFWKRNNFVKFIVKFFVYSLLLSPRIDNFTRIVKGIIDGIKMK